MKSLYIFAFLLVVLPLHAFAGGRGRCLGCYKPIENITDPYVQELGKFAVSEYNKEYKRNLIFVEVVEGEQQLVNGRNYKLIVVAKDGDTKIKYEAIVFVNLEGTLKKLVSFIRIECVGCYKPIENITDPYVQKLGAFAVSEYNKEHNKSLKFVEVVAGEYQVVAGTNYRLIVEKEEGSVKEKCVAIVFVNLRGKKKLVSFEC